MRASPPSSSASPRFTKITRTPEAEIERAIALGLKGLKLHPDTQMVNMDDPRLMRIYEIIEGRLPLIVHTGDYRYDYSHPRRLKNILNTFPDLVVDAAHFGGWSIYDLAIEYLENERCFLDMSSAQTFLGPRRTYEITKIYGCDRVMFGSDFPCGTPPRNTKCSPHCPSPKKSSKTSPGTTPSDSSDSKSDGKCRQTSGGKMRKDPHARVFFIVSEKLDKKLDDLSKRAL